MSPQPKTDYDTPLAYVTSKRRRDGTWSWTVAVCPCCGYQHSHRGGEKDFPAYLGHVAAHFRVGRTAGFVLVEAAKRNEADTAAAPKWRNSCFWILTVFDGPYCDGLHKDIGGSGDVVSNYGRRQVPPCISSAGFVVVELTQ